MHSNKHAGSYTNQGGAPSAVCLIVFFALEGSMFVIDASADPTVHRACCRIAKRLVFLIRPLLRGADDRNLALREAYAIAREEIEKNGTEEPSPEAAAGNGQGGETNWGR
jgi:hypothetical protein